jgi:prevent-host-death family protein
MNRSLVSIMQARQDIPSLVNRVACNGERIILTARGEPQVALISIDDLRILEQVDQEKAHRMAALEEAQAPGERIRAERTDHDVDSMELVRQLREPTAGVRTNTD